MSDERWIIVRKWGEFQHYQDRNPPWIKNYTRLLSDPNYLSLTPHQCAVLHRLWLEYARSGCQLRANTASLSRQLGLRVSSRQLEALSHAGFIRFSASAVLAPSRAREETETEKKNTISLETSAVARENETKDGGENLVNDEEVHWPVQIPDELWRMP